MTKTYLLTAPRETTHIKELKIMLEELDAKQWIIARESGAGGYEHYQCRATVSGDLPGWIQRNGLCWYYDEANEVWDYEQKEGDYFCSWDTLGTRELRTGRLNDVQRLILRSTDKQNNRMVTVWIDPKGGSGKTWALLRGVQRGEVLPVPAYGVSAQKLSGWIHSAYNGQSMIWVDIPRGLKYDHNLWIAIEEAKGIVYDWRYKSSWKITYGVKILVTCNNYLSKEDYKCLSDDRWDVYVLKEAHGIHGYYKPEWRGGETSS